MDEVSLALGHHHQALPQLKRGHNVFKVKPMVHHHDELPQTVQVAKILAAQELIIWPRNQQLGRKPGKHVQDERRSQTSGVTQEERSYHYYFFYDN